MREIQHHVRSLFVLSQTVLPGHRPVYRHPRLCNGNAVSSFSRSHVRSYLVRLHSSDILLYSNATWIPTSLDLIVSGSRSEVVEGLHRTSGGTWTGRAHMGPGTAHGLSNSKIAPPLGTTLQQSAGYPTPLVSGDPGGRGEIVTRTLANDFESLRGSRVDTARVEGSHASRGEARAAGTPTTNETKTLAEEEGQWWAG